MQQPQRAGGQQLHGKGHVAALHPPHHLCRWGSAAQNKREDWAIKKWKQANRFKRRALSGYHPTCWMLHHDGFPLQAGLKEVFPEAPRADPLEIV